jgi:hypothetical protein
MVDRRSPGDGSVPVRQRQVRHVAGNRAPRLNGRYPLTAKSIHFRILL